MASPRFDFNMDYEEVAASQADQVLGATGAQGDILERVVMTVTTALTSAVSIKDGNGSAIPLLAANTPIGVYNAEIGARAKNSVTPGWKITTAAGVSAVGIGKFT